MNYCRWKSKHKSGTQTQKDKWFSFLFSSRAASALSRSASVRQRGLSNDRATPDFQTSTVIVMSINLNAGNDGFPLSIMMDFISRFFQVTVYNKFAKKVTKKFLEVSLYTSGSCQLLFYFHAFSQVGQGVMSIPNKEMGLVGILREILRGVLFH